MEGGVGLVERWSWASSEQQWKLILCLRKNAAAGKDKDEEEKGPRTEPWGAPGLLSSMCWSSQKLTLSGFSFRYGGSPSIISMAMMPRDQMSTLGP